MENRCLYKIEFFHTLGTPQSEQLKVTALNLFYPTASPLFYIVGLFILRHSLKGEVRGDLIILQRSFLDQPILNTMAAPVSPAAQPAHRP